ncbi:hypothetical protein [Companilactobacillus sp. HBUAS56275]
MKKITAFLLSLLMLLGVFAPAAATPVQAKSTKKHQSYLYFEEK